MDKANQWLLEFSAAEELAKQFGKSILLQFHRDGCAGCKKLYANTYPDANVERELFGNAATYDIKSAVRTDDYGFALGAKIGFAKGSHEFGVDVRYAAGLTTPDATARDIELKSRTITVMLELYFGQADAE